MEPPWLTKATVLFSSLMLTGQGSGSCVVQRDVPQLAPLYLSLHLYLLSTLHSSQARVSHSPESLLFSPVTLSSKMSLPLVTLWREKLRSPSCYGLSHSSQSHCLLGTEPTISHFHNMSPSNYFTVTRRLPEAGVTSCSGLQTQPTGLCLLWLALHCFYRLTYWR